MSRAVQAVGLTAALALAQSAWAHSPIEGMNSFYGGVLHPMLVPAHLVLLLALGLLLGGQPARCARIGTAAWLLAVVAGLLVLAWGDGLTTTPALLAATAAMGVMVAAAWRPPVVLVAVLAFAVGAGLALDSEPDIEATSERALALLGTALGAVLVVAAGLLVAEVGARRDWQRIAVRVLGSWIAASALMVSALGFVGSPEADRSAATGPGLAMTPTVATPSQR